MTKAERVLAVLQGKEPDHTPCGFSLHFPQEQKKGQAAVEAHLKFFAETDTDICKIMNENLVPSVGELRSPRDWRAFDSLDLGFVREQGELSKRIREKGPQDVFWLGTLHGITASSIHPVESALGYENARTLVMEHLRENPEPVLDGMKKIAEAMCSLALEYKKAGMDGIYYASLGGERDRWFTDEEFARWVEPFDKLILSEIQKAGCFAFLHICKDGLNMERYRKYQDVCDIVNWGVYEAPFSLEDGKKLFPGKPVMGGLQNHEGVLVTGSREELQEEVRRLAGQYGPGGFILGADCTLPTDIPTQRIRWAVEALR